MTAAYDQISGSDLQATLAYRSTVEGVGDLASLADVGEAMHKSLLDRRNEELARSVTLVGPHRDDLVLELAGTAAKGFASHGESWSICLALRLASFEVMRGLTDDAPVLILDDVFAELDSERRKRLVAAVSGADQVLVTAAVGSDVPSELGGTHFGIEKEDTSRIVATT